MRHIPTGAAKGERMRIGKLTNEELSDMVLSELKYRRSETVLRAGVGEDCGAVEIGGQVCVLSTDPITVPCDGAGSLAIQISVNDVATSGAEPMAALMTILAPPEAEAGEIRDVMRQAFTCAARENIEIIGGHTEVTDAVNRIVLSVTVVGRANRAALRHTSGARPGDAIVMTKYAGIEGTRIMLGDSREGKRFAAMISITAEARVATACGAHAMHDVTEGGVLGAAWEMAEASGLFAAVDADAIPILPETARLCAERGIDPLRLISSGSLLVAHPDGPALVSALAERGIPAAVIGSFVTDAHTLLRGGRTQPLDPPESDEIYRL